MSLLLTYGEIMLRVSPISNTRLAGATMAELSFGGAEANAAVAASHLGATTRFVTAVPDSALGDSVINTLRGYGVDTSCIVRSGSRLGIYYVERGSGFRPSTVLYDRANSSVTSWQPSYSELQQSLVGVTHFHFTGITAALDGAALPVLKQFLFICNERGVRVSMDVNYRSKLWDTGTAGTVLRDLLPLVSSVICNENHAKLLFDYASSCDMDVARAFKSDYINIDTAVITRRRGLDFQYDQWSAVGVDADGTEAQSAERTILMTERVGGGDAFAGGFLTEQMANKPLQESIDFGAAALALKHGIPGDFCLFSRSEVLSILNGVSSFGVVR